MIGCGRWIFSIFLFILFLKSESEELRNPHFCSVYFLLPLHYSIYTTIFLNDLLLRDSQPYLYILLFLNDYAFRFFDPNIFSYDCKFRGCIFILSILTYSCLSYRFHRLRPLSSLISLFFCALVLSYESTDFVNDEQVHAYYKFGSLSACLCVNYLDRFLSAYELPVRIISIAFKLMPMWMRHSILILR